MSLAESREIIGHVEWETRVDAALKAWRESDHESDAREAVLIKLKAIGVPDWAAQKWVGSGQAS